MISLLKVKYSLFENLKKEIPKNSETLNVREGVGF